MGSKLSSTHIFCHFFDVRAPKLVGGDGVGGVGVGGGGDGCGGLGGLGGLGVISVVFSDKSENPRVGMVMVLMIKASEL